MLKELPLDNLETNITQLYKDMPQVEKVISKSKVDSSLKTIKEIVNEKSQNMFSYNLDDIIDNIFSQKNVVEAINTMKKLSNTIKTVPEIANKNPELNGIINLLKSKTIPIDRSILTELEKLNVTVKPVNGEITLEEAVNLYSKVKDKIKALKIKDFYNNMPEQFRNPKNSIASFKSHIEKLSDEQFAQQMENIGFSSMDKATMLKILPKVEKILDNIPKEEMQKIWTTIIKEFNEHPDEFIKLVKSGKVGSLFMTPGLKKAIAAIGISWTVFTLAITYAIESWLADMQLKAGRLGVMKAIESLDDPRYYANIEPVETPKQPQESPASATDSNLLARIKRNTI